MYRARYHFKLRSGEQWNSFIETCRKLNQLAQNRGWTQYTVWTQTVGPFNELVLESDYPDLATFEFETRELYADEEAMKVVSGWRDLVIEASGHNELWEEAETVAS